MPKLTELLLLLVIPALIFLHLFVSPYTKVEESFNIQAVHDILTYGIPTTNVSNEFHANYDHFTFPGAVPRTFVGAIFLAGLSRPFIWLKAGLKSQLLVRGILGALNAAALISYARAVRKSFGREAGIWYVLLQASQFHVIYYASRTLPNMFAFGITTVALQSILPTIHTGLSRVSSGRYRLCLYLLTVVGIVFRSEVALLLHSVTINHWFSGNVGLRQEIIPAGLTGLVVGILITVPIDSFFWQKLPLWPELSAFLFNVLFGKASEWGVHPWHFYFTNSIPRLLLNPLLYIFAMPLACIVTTQGKSADSLVSSTLHFLVALSFQPHKEWRFIIYIIPWLTTVAAVGASYAWTHRSKSLFYRFISISLILSTLASFVVSTFVLLPASMANYPGAHALNRVHELADGSKSIIAVHLDTLACQTGVTHFLEKPPPKSPLIVLPGSPDGTIPALRSGASRWIYDKTEDEEVKRSTAFWDRLDYALVENPNQIQGTGKWQMVEEIYGFGGITLLRPGQEGSESVERKIASNLFGNKGEDTLDLVKRSVRQYLTRGWWVEMKMVPKIKIMMQTGNL